MCSWDKENKCTEGIPTTDPLMASYYFFFPTTHQVANVMLTSQHGGCKVARKWWKTFALSLPILSSQISHLNAPFSLLFLLPSGSTQQHGGLIPDFVGVPGASSGSLKSNDTECLV